MCSSLATLKQRLPAQSVYIASQAIPHAAFPQMGRPFNVPGHGFWQPPQLAGSLAKSTHWSPAQRLYPMLQAISHESTVPVQVATPLRAGPLQAVHRVPQLAGDVLSTQ